MNERCENPEEYESESDLEELRERIDALEAYEGGSGSGGIDSTIPYLSGLALAMILS